MSKLTHLFCTILFVSFSFQSIAQNNTTIKPVLASYIELKEALVNTNSEQSSQLAKNLMTTIASVKMSDLNSEVHDVWMKVVNYIKEDAEHINESKDIDHQRASFISLSQNMYSVIKIAKADIPVYYQFCPMANKGKGAYWLSLENKIKNPYYGNKMLSCGKVVESIQ